MNKISKLSVIAASLFALVACNSNNTNPTEETVSADSVKTAEKTGVSTASKADETKPFVKPDVKKIGVALFCNGDTTELNDLLEGNSRVFKTERFFELVSEGDFEQKNICYYWVRNDKKILVASFGRYIGFEPKPNGSLGIAHSSNLSFYLYDPTTNKLDSIANPITPALYKPGKDQRIDAYFAEKSDSDNFTVVYCNSQERSLEDAKKKVTLKWNGMGFDRE